MKVIRVNSKNVILIFFALLSHIIREVHMCYGNGKFRAYFLLLLINVF